MFKTEYKIIVGEYTEYMSTLMAQTGKIITKQERKCVLRVYIFSKYILCTFAYYRYYI